MAAAQGQMTLQPRLQPRDGNSPYMWSGTSGAIAQLDNDNLYMLTIPGGGVPPLPFTFNVLVVEIRDAHSTALQKFSEPSASTMMVTPAARYNNVHLVVTATRMTAPNPVPQQIGFTLV